MIIERQVRFQRKQRAGTQAARPAKASNRVPRVAKLMALAIRFDVLIRNGLVSDQAELARLGHVTRARLTQIMNLLSLAPDIQEQILLLHQVAPGRASMTEKLLRPILAVHCWMKQREMWNAIHFHSANVTIEPNPKK